MSSGDRLRHLFQVLSAPRPLACTVRQRKRYPATHALPLHKRLPAPQFLRIYQPDARRGGQTPVTGTGRFRLQRRQRLCRVRIPLAFDVFPCLQKNGGQHSCRVAQPNAGRSITFYLETRCEFTEGSRKFDINDPHPPEWVPARAIFGFVELSDCSVAFLPVLAFDTGQSLTHP